MLKLLNPVVLWAGIKGAPGLLKAEPISAGVLWVASGIQTTVQMWLVSMAHPEWARQLAAQFPQWWDTGSEVGKEFIRVAWEFWTGHF